MAIILNGTDQGVNCGLSDALLSSAGSVFAYMEITASRVADEVYLGLGMRSDDTRAIEIVGIASGETFQVLVSGGSTMASQASGGIKNGSPRRVFVAWSQESGRRFCYVDGVQVSEAFFAVPSPDNTFGGETTLGYRPWAAEPRWLQGSLANIALWTGPQFGTLADENAAAISLTTALATVSQLGGFAAYWPLDYDARDLGPHGLDGTLVGSPTFTEPVPRWIRGDGTALRPYVKTSGGLQALE